MIDNKWGEDPIGITRENNWRVVDNTLYHANKYDGGTSYEDGAASYINAGGIGLNLGFLTANFSGTKTHNDKGVSTTFP